MKLRINPKTFVNNFLNPIKALNREGRVPFFIDGNDIYTASSNKSGTVKLYSTYTPLLLEKEEGEEERFNIDFLKLEKGLSCAQNEEYIDILINQKEKTCAFKSDDIQFTIKLLESRMVTESKFRVAVFKNFPIDYTVEVDGSVSNKLRKALSFSESEEGKIYLEQDDDGIYCFFGNKSDSTKSSDSIRVQLTSAFNQKIPQKIYDALLIKLALNTKNDFSINLNQNGVMFIELEHTNSNLKYIATPLVK